MITDYGLGHGRALLLKYILSIWLGSCAAVSLRGLSIRDFADVRIQHTLSQMVWQPLFELAMSTEASRVATLCRPRLRRLEDGKGLWDSKGNPPLIAPFNLQCQPSFELFGSLPGRLPYTPYSLVLSDCSLWIPTGFVS